MVRSLNVTSSVGVSWCWEVPSSPVGKYHLHGNVLKRITSPLHTREPAWRAIPGHELHILDKACPSSERRVHPRRGVTIHGEACPSSEWRVHPWRGVSILGEAWPSLERRVHPRRGVSILGEACPSLEGRFRPWRDVSIIGETWPSLECYLLRLETRAVGRPYPGEGLQGFDQLETCS